jgi:hypothetical protein
MVKANGGAVPMTRLALAIVACLLAIGPVLAQSEAQVSSGVTVGWTDNAGETPDGLASRFVVHRHALAVGGATEGLVLRGSLSSSHTRFLELPEESDVEAGGRVEADLTAGPLVLRAGLGVDVASVGELVVTDLGPLGLRTTEGGVEGYLEAGLTLSETWSASLALSRRLAFVGDTRVTGLDTAPLALAADVRTTSVAAALEYRPGHGIAARLAMDWQAAEISAVDQASFGRVPTEALSMQPGLVLEDAAGIVGAGAGLILVRPRGFPDLALWSPGFSALIERQVFTALRVAGEAALEAELAEPIDGVAGRVARMDGRLELAIAPDWAARIEAGASRQSGFYDPLAISIERRAAIGLSHASPSGLSGDVNLERRWIDDPGGSFDKTTVSITLSGQI